jgi:hypothetical protein
MTVKTDIKSIILQSGWTMTAIVKALNEKYNREDTLQDFSNKLARGTILYTEVLKIAEVIGYEIRWIKK